MALSGLERVGRRWAVTGAGLLAFLDEDGALRASEAMAGAPCRLAARSGGRLIHASGATVRWFDGPRARRQSTLSGARVVELAAWTEGRAVLTFRRGEGMGLAVLRPPGAGRY